MKHKEGTQIAVAKAVGISPGFLSDIKSRKKPCPPKRAKLISDETGISTDLLIFGTKAQLAAAWKKYKKRVTGGRS